MALGANFLLNKETFGWTNRKVLISSNFVTIGSKFSCLKAFFCDKDLEKVRFFDRRKNFVVFRFTFSRRNQWFAVSSGRLPRFFSGPQNRTCGNGFSLGWNRDRLRRWIQATKRQTSFWSNRFVVKMICFCRTVMSVTFTTIETFLRNMSEWKQR